jgi:hypothetical protein
MRTRGTFFALALILAGLFLFLDNLGLIPVAHIGAYWPLALVVYGLAGIFHRRSATAAIWSVALIAGGVLLTLGNLHVLRVNGGVIWPILLIGVGFTMLVNRSRWEELSTARRQRWEVRREWKRQMHNPGAWHASHYAMPTTAPAPGGQLREAAVFFSLRRRFENELTRGELSAVFGSIDLDLTGAVIPLAASQESAAAPSRRALLEATAVFGSIDIAVPREWRILKEGLDGRPASGVFGSFEDRTIPARPEPGAEPPTLVLRGEAVFGSVTVHN